MLGVGRLLLRFERRELGLPAGELPVTRILHPGGRRRLVDRAELLEHAQ
jgi:hypothetical protein